MIAIDIPMPDNCYIGKKKCPLLDKDMDCKLQPESHNMDTLFEQFRRCPLIDLTDDGK